MLFHEIWEQLRLNTYYQPLNPSNLLIYASDVCWLFAAQFTTQPSEEALCLASFNSMKVFDGVQPLDLAKLSKTEDRHMDSTACRGICETNRSLFSNLAPKWTTHWPPEVNLKPISDSADLLA